MNECEFFFPLSYSHSKFLSLTNNNFVIIFISSDSFYFYQNFSHNTLLNLIIVKRNIQFVRNQ